MTFYIGLLHYPVYNKRGEIIASAITNLDLHDLARLAKTYGAGRFYVITPLADQQDLAERICQHWVSGFGALYNKDRQEAMSLISVVPSLEKSMEEIKDREGELPALMVTDAGKNKRERITYEMAREIVASTRVIMLLFGTAWGIAQELMRKADYVLAPIVGVSQYNHLSVRAAAAITLDRLFSRFAESQGGR
ncbi:MAG: RNA methyltransferase [Deltaproteobacteria bacterium]|nr:MAG: RNA methyltransferase [Deltaproteobacteria bacterium]